MNNQFDRLREAVARKNTQNRTISNWSVGQQIEHSANVVTSICKALHKSNPEKYNPKFNFGRSLCLATKWIPRGKGKAPKWVIPNEKELAEETLFGLINEAEENFISIDKLSPKSYFKHGYFGQMNLKQAKKFVEIHSNHHLKIIDDLVKSSN